MKYADSDCRKYRKCGILIMTVSFCFDTSSNIYVYKTTVFRTQNPAKMKHPYQKYPKNQRCPQGGSLDFCIISILLLIAYSQGLWYNSENMTERRESFLGFKKSIFSRRSSVHDGFLRSPEGISIPYCPKIFRSPTGLRGHCSGCGTSADASYSHAAQAYPQSDGGLFVSDGTFSIQ